MQCQICHKNNATIHLTEISGGKRTEMHLCEYCAAEKDITVKSHLPINELLSNLLASQPSDDELTESFQPDLTCPYCNFTLSQFTKDGLMGCPYDYEIFEKALLPLIEKAHDGKTVHCGKVPLNMPPNAKQKNELLILRQKLQVAIQAEDYELAAKLRDEIKQNESNRP